jgi:hypothetical protein
VKVFHTLSAERLMIHYFARLQRLNPYYTCTDKGTQSMYTLRCDSGFSDGSGPSSEFLAKILGADTSWFLCNTQFYFPLSSLLLCKSNKRITSSVHHHSSVGSVYACGAVDPGSVPKYTVFLLPNLMVVKVIKSFF